MKRKVLISIVALALFSIGIWALAQKSQNAYAAYQWHHCVGNNDEYCEYGDRTPSSGPELNLVLPWPM